MPFVDSLRARVVLWIGVALVAMFAVTIVGLDAAFRSSTNRAIQELLQVQLLGLIALALPDPSGRLSLPADAINPQFGVPDSGLYGALWDADGGLVWQSQSFVGRELAAPVLPGPGIRRYLALEPPGLPPLEALLMGIAWEFADGRVEFFTFGIAVSLEPYNERQVAFRNNLITWFAGLTATTVLVLVGLLNWVLRPLKRLERQVREVESGRRGRLTGRYPAELVGLAANLNALIETERRRLVRYRHTLDDLAHSLKTPLAAMRTLLFERAPADGADALHSELDRMDQRVSYQLRRARASGATGLGLEPVRVGPILDDLIGTLDKVYRDKQVACETDVEPGAAFYGDAGDLTEVLGNLLDNAYKYCRSRVEVAARSVGARLTVRIGDDGPGIEPESLRHVLERGGRVDETVPGQGIGLAVVSETIELYHGTLAFGRSELGGLEVKVGLARAGNVP
jgi:two-component system, OmpR family, sensor histidine kinase PhoQ